MADDKYKSGPYKGQTKEKIKAIRDFLKDSGASADEVDIMSILESDYFGGYNKGGMVKSRTGPQDFRKGGMVLKTMDNRKNK